MIAILILTLLFLGAIATFLIPSHHRTAHILVSLVPVAAALALLLRIPLRDSFALPWSPASLFPDPLFFRATPVSIAFAFYFCCLLILIEWTRPLRSNPGSSSRLVSYLLSLSGIAACFASNPLAVVILWSLMDFLSFLAMVFLKSPVEIGPAGISSTLSHSMGILAANMIGNILVAFSLFAGSPGAASDWDVVWSALPSALAPALFLSGILFRILVAPVQGAALRIQPPATGTEVLLRIIAPAASLCLLANIWPSQLISSSPGGGFTWVVILLIAVLLAAGWRWSVSPSAAGRRESFFFLLPSFALLSALVCPQASGVFLAAGGMLILGGGILLIYLGYLANRRWMAAFPVLLGVLFAGIPLSPMSVWSESVYPSLFSPTGIPVLAALALCQIFIMCAIFRLAFEPVEEFPSNEPLLLFTFSAGLTVGLLALVFPFRGGSLSGASLVAPPILLAAAILFLFFLRRVHRSGATRVFFLQSTLRMDWLQRSIVFIFRQAGGFVSGVESFLSGEGAMLWSLGIALLLYLAFRGG